MSKEKKMSPEDLAGLLHMRSRGGSPKPKKGKGSWERNKRPTKDDE